MKYLLRFGWFTLRLLCVLLLVATLSFAAYTHGMNRSFISILLQSGMDIRASVQFGLSGRPELNKYFTRACLESDPIWKNEEYANYEIASFDTDFSLEKLTTWPWLNTAEAVVLHDVTRIDGYKKLSAQTPEELKNPNKIPAPAWKGGEYVIHLVKKDQSWLIESIEKTRDMEMPPRFTAEPTPYGQTVPPPTPKATATPAATLTPVFTPAPSQT
ncbi:MAG: hypothetical protein II781_04005 [Clostridia bacterium]|nr:hypothetical protein [Clostridia bacterium]